MPHSVLLLKIFHLSTCDVLFLPSPLDGRMACLGFPVIVNNSARNIGVQVSESLLSAVLRTHRGMGVPDQIIILGLSCNGNTILSSTVCVRTYSVHTVCKRPHPFTFPPARHRGSNFFTSPPTLGIFGFL